MNNIAILRKQFGLSQKEFGKKIGVAQNTVCNWEKGNREPDNESLRKMSELFNVSIDYILGHEDQKEKPSEDGELDEDMAVISKLVERLTPEQLDPVLDVVKNISSLNPDQIRSIAEVIKNMAK